MHNLSSDYYGGSSSFPQKVGDAISWLLKKGWSYFNVLIGKRAVALKPAIASFPSFFFSLTIKEGYFLYSNDINDYIAWKAAAENYN